jgi:hypothetical protein
MGKCLTGLPERKTRVSALAKYRRAHRKKERLRKIYRLGVLYGLNRSRKLYGFCRMYGPIEHRLW